MGKSQRDKGYRTENNLRNLFNDAGIECKRVPLSGGANGFSGDLIITDNGADKVGEVKARAEGFKEVYRWLDGADFLFLKADRRPYLAVLRLDDFLSLLKRNCDQKSLR